MSVGLVSAMTIWAVRNGSSGKFRGVRENRQWESVSDRLERIFAVKLVPSSYILLKAADSSSFWLVR
jgi:hypothetical protein